MPRSAPLLSSHFSVLLKNINIFESNWKKLQQQYQSEMWKYMICTRHKVNISAKCCLFKELLDIKSCN